MPGWFTISDTKFKQLIKVISDKTPHGKYIFFFLLLY